MRPRLRAGPGAPAAAADERWADVAAAAAAAVSGSLASAGDGAAADRVDDGAAGGGAERSGAPRSAAEGRARGFGDRVRRGGPEAVMAEWAAQAAAAEAALRAWRARVGDLGPPSNEMERTLDGHFLRSMESHVERALARRRGLPLPGAGAAGRGQAGEGGER